MGGLNSVSRRLTALLAAVVLALGVGLAFAPKARADTFTVVTSNSCNFTKRASGLSAYVKNVSCSSARAGIAYLNTTTGQDVWFYGSYVLAGETSSAGSPFSTIAGHEADVIMVIGSTAYSTSVHF